MTFDKGFLWGVASAAPQVEGAWNEDGKTPSIWDVVPPQKVKNQDNCHVACDHYHRYKEDVALMKKLGIKSYRFSVSWPRIMPQKGKVNEKGIAFYRDLVATLRDAGIEPLVTLYHWDLPFWVHQEGGWKNEKIVAYFCEYARVVVDALSDQVQYWMTVNEPQVFIMSGYVLGTFAPFKHHVLSFRKKHMRHMLLCHGKTVEIIRKNAKKKPKIGIAMASSAYVPQNESKEAIEQARSYTFEHKNGDGSNSMYMDPIALGKTTPMLGNILSEEDLKIISAPIDFIGLNIYQPLNPGIDKDTTETVRESMMGWVVDPRCMYWTIRFYHERYHLPIMVTENGIACPDVIAPDGHVHDEKRIEFLDTYLSYLKRAVEEGYPVLGYQCWSLMDNFEWCEGYAARFGICYVDYESQKRIIKDSGYYYANIIKSNGKEIEVKK